MKKDAIIRAWLVVGLFVIFLLFPFINSTLNLVDDVKSFENRALHPKPHFDINKLDPFPPQYEKYYNDHFALRNRLIKQFNVLNIKMFRKSPLPESLVIGNDGWLFSTGEEMDSYMGRNSLTDEELVKFKTELDFRTDYLRNLGCELYFMIVPCKASIYGDKIGYEYHRTSPYSWGEALNRYLRTNSRVNVIDLFEGLRAKRNGQPIYYKHDSHWNELGAFYACNIALNEMRKQFKELTPLPATDYIVGSGGNRPGNISGLMGNIDLYSEDSVLVKPRNGLKSEVVQKVPYPPVEGFAYQYLYEINREIPGSKAPRLLVISDSFGEFIFPFLAEKFSRSVKIFDAWQYKLAPEIVAGEKPQVLLLMIDEPILRNLLNFTSAPALNK